METKDKNSFYLSLAGTVLISFSLILPMITISGYIADISLGLFDVTNGLGIILYLAGLGLAAYSTMKTKNYDKSLPFSVGSFIVIGLLLLILNSDVSNINSQSSILGV